METKECMAIKSITIKVIEKEVGQSIKIEIRTKQSEKVYTSEAVSVLAEAIQMIVKQ
ncbi:hypothetical protein [Fibrisoma montanum]|uniref:hypothetical protein n=1 Tax=Fibrisoma montanum TaxID=2305895 RepID=UPI0013141BBC|nr:hypothetical protein [Fibrisoma montanum]